MVVALRRRHPYDVFWMHGPPEEIARDTLFKGTALSAPVSNLLTHAAMTAVVTRRPSRRAEQALGGLGALLVAGYLGERLVRQRLRPSGWDGLESPLVVMRHRTGSSHGSDWSGRIPRDGDCGEETCCGSPLSGNSR